MNIAIVQARVNSSRLPGKVLSPLGGKSILAWTIESAQAAGKVDAIVVATSIEAADDAVCNEATRMGAQVVRGPLDDVLTRFKLVSDEFPAENYVRLTADCPLIDPKMIDQCIWLLESNDCLDLVSNALVRTYPRGLDVEVFRQSALLSADSEAYGYHRSHVTSWMIDHPNAYGCIGLVSGSDDSDLRVTVDTPDDLSVVRSVIDGLGPGPHSAGNVITWLRRHPDIARKNSHVEQKADEQG